MDKGAISLKSSRGKQWPDELVIMMNTHTHTYTAQWCMCEVMFSEAALPSMLILPLDLQVRGRVEVLNMQPHTY